jgi:hypothetical protein
MGLSAAAAAALNAANMAEARRLLSLTSATMAYDGATGRLTPAPRADALGAAVPDRAPARPPVVLRKRLRLHPHWRLRPARRWVDFAPYLTSIRIAFDPILDGSAGARELARQVQSVKVRTRFSKVAVKVAETSDGEPAIVEVKWVRPREGRQDVTCASIARHTLGGRKLLRLTCHPAHAPPSAEQWQDVLRARAVRDFRGDPRAF